MILEFVNVVLVVLLISLEIFAISLVIRSMNRRRSTVLPGYIRDFDDTPSPNRAQLNKRTIQYISLVSMVGGGIIMAVNMSQFLFGVGILFVVFGAILQILILKDSKKKRILY